MAQVVWTDEALRWLENVHDYIAAENAAAASNVVTGIYQKTLLLRDPPRLGQRYELISDREVREILYGHYRIPYLVVSESRVDILGVFHSAMDIQKYLN